jgi:DNA sulfur modification protein DndC
MKQIEMPLEVKDADVIFASHSGGKDSQAMLAALKRMGLLHKVVIVHADLGEMEWEHMAPWIEKNSFGLPVHVVKQDYDFFHMVESWGYFPRNRAQFCTDELKTQPITKFIHDYMYEHGCRTAINCTGMRGEESPRRAKKAAFCLSKGEETSGMHKPNLYKTHTVYDWLPLKDYLVTDVMAEIENAGQEIHKVYGLGFSRLSCVFCINGQINEHKAAAILRPELAQRMIELEIKVGKTVRIKSVKKQKVRHFMKDYLFSKMTFKKNQRKMPIPQVGCGI